jgi:tripartite-type tricarboxylate transporter receptor subunit TctC
MNAAARRRALARLGALGLAAVAPRRASASAAAESADAYPSRTIRVVVGSAPGAGDIVPRLYAARLAEAFGQPVVVENRPGASFNIASETVARAPADGYTLLFATTQITLTPAILGPSVVDPVAAFAPITKVFTTPPFVFAHRSLRVSTLPELLDQARAAPGRIAYARTGVIPYVLMETILKRAGVKMLQVPYANAGQALANFTSGEVPVYATFYVSALSAVKDGTARALAVMSDRRSPSLPDAPTVVELGYPDAALDAWSGFVAPAGTPREIVAKLHREIVRIAQLPEVRERHAQLGLDPLTSTPEAFAADIRAHTARWPAMVRATGVTLLP